MTRALAHLRRDFLARLESLGCRLPEPPDGPRGDFYDDAQATEAREQAFLLHGRRLAEREALVYAIERIDAGKYSVCDDCNDDIPPKRMAAMPLTTRCRDCQEAEEARVKRASGAMVEED